MLVDALLDAGRHRPRTLAVEDPTVRLTYRRLVRLAAVFRREILALSDCPRVGIMLPASALFPAVLFGTWWARRCAVPLNFLLAKEEIARIVEDAGLEHILTIRPFSELVEGLPVAPVYLESLPLKRRLLAQTVRPLPPPPSVEPDETVVLLYTSGTTAEPKGVELTCRNLHSNVVDSIAALGLTAPQMLLNILPPFHVFGLTANVLVPVFLQASVAAVPRFHPVHVVRTLSQKPITIMMAIPSMYAAILRTKSATRETFRSVRLAISGGEPLSESVREGFRERFGVSLCEGYGLTETSPVVAVSSPEDNRPGTVGRPIPHVEVQIRDEQGRPLPAGAEGEIFLRGPGVMKGYYRKPEQTRAVLSGDGWLATGDIGRLDADGFLFITGRAKEMLIIGGENVFPREIESALEAHEDVLQAAVIGVPDPSRGEAPVAFVLPRPGTHPEEMDLRGFARERLAGFKVPKRVIVREDLPRGPTGKILKRKLRELLDGA